ncbi:retropepsin-like domain-containing protein [Aestuariibacter sp. AA17]|uniref:Retropepsin-like domain-containing protein n=1 Tax=Fluctibacter corallii TaxID=2984329 RepID=A0ABT3A3B3_9ALTE|nr:retropepsin-like domain-containing protein [Aestuariibacter sp. AA17]MCV2883169.1 retropepsin-like domain-containing protein [Aestuariibacter sp. AA17]
MKTISTALITTIILTGCSSVSHQTPYTQHFPIMKTDTGHAYIYADVGAMTDFPLIIDTAANMGVMPKTGMEEIQVPSDSLHEDSINGANGASMMLKGEVPMLSLGHTTHEDVEHLFVDLSKFVLSDGRIPGILGHNVLEHHCVALDMQASVMSLASPSCAGISKEGLQAVPFEIIDDFIQFKASFNGQEVSAVLDTGAGKSFINSHAFSLLEDAQIAESDTASDLHGKEQETKTIENIHYQINHIDIDESIMAVADLSVFDVLGFKDEPFLLMGIHYFQDKKLVIDYKNQVFYL